MRSLSLILLAFCASAAVAQMEEDKPPVIRRGSSPRADADTNSAGKKPSTTLGGAGIVRRIDSHTLEVLLDDGRIFSAAIDAKTAFIGPEGKVDPSAVAPGARVRISVRASDERELTATSVVVEKPVASVKPEEDAVIMRAEDADPDRPVLKRGMPQRVAKSDNETELEKDDTEAAPREAMTKPATAPSTAAGKPEGDDSLASLLTSDNQPELLKKAHEANQEFTAHMPNFVCQQFTTRYERENKITGWKAKDIISATVVYDGHGEHYDNIKVNNRPVKTDMMSIKGGAQSVGDFGSFLEGTFDARVHAEFRYLHAELFRRVHTKVFAYSVKRERTDWTIRFGGESIEPAYSGRIWIDAESGRVMRIERQADNVPEAFPLVAAEQTIDYDNVMLGGRKVLLPVESSVLECERASSFCSRNVIQFRDYKEFRGEANVTFDK